MSLSRVYFLPVAAIYTSVTGQFFGLPIYTQLYLASLLPRAVGHPPPPRSLQGGVKSTPSSTRLLVGVILTDPEPVNKTLIQLF